MYDTPSTQKTALKVSCSTHVVQDGLITTVYVLLPLLAQAFGLSYAQVGLLKGLKGLTQAAFEMGSGWLSERLGEIRLIVVGLACSGIGYGVLSLGRGIEMAALALVIIGVGTALHHAPCSALIANSYPARSRSGALGLYNASGDVGKLVFTGGVSLTIGMGMAWSQAALVYGGLAMCTALAIAVSAGRANDTTETKSTSDTASQESGRGWGILNWRMFAALLVVTSIDTMVQISVMVFIAFLMLAKGVPLAIATSATVILLAGGVFGKAGCGYLAERVGVRPAFVLIQVLTSLGLVGMVVLPNSAAFLLLLPLGAVVQGSSSITYGFAADLIHPRCMARGYALLYSVGTFAAAIGPFGFGVIADVYGINATIFVMALVALCAVPPIFMLRQNGTAVA